MLPAMDDAALPATAPGPLERARLFIEANARAPLTLETIAGLAGLSAYHFARQFGARFGVSPMAYVRERRMAAAAHRLCDDPQTTLVNLAFELGFESQEGFTRAFKRAFGVSPGRYRRERPPLEDRPPMPDVTPAPRLTQEPAPVRKAAFRVAGLSGRFTETDKAGIPALWGRLGPRLPLPGQTGGGTFGVGWSAGPEGGFNYMAAAPIAPGAPAPEGLEAKDVPAQTYLVFRLAIEGGDLHVQMQAASREIWGERIPRSRYKLAGGPDFEAYPADFQPGGPATLEWWIPVEA
jgi:AraC family transcriptional regulator